MASLPPPVNMPPVVAGDPDCSAQVNYQDTLEQGPQTSRCKSKGQPILGSFPQISYKKSTHTS